MSLETVQDMQQSAEQDSSLKPPAQGQKWSTGPWSRFPVLSLCCFCIVIACGVSSVAVLLLSDGQDVKTWGSSDIFSKFSAGENAHSHNISVGAWLALFVFVAGKALETMFLEAVAISWWVRALDGRSLKRLHFHWEVSQFTFKILSKPKLLGWAGVASAAFALFAGLETLLQSATSSTTAVSTINANMTAELAAKLPDGFSGLWVGAVDPAFSVISFLTTPFSHVAQDFTAKSAIALDIQGCATTSNVSCATTLSGVGFSYSCQSGRFLISPSPAVIDQHRATIFSTILDWNSTDFWNLRLTAWWKDLPQQSGPVITSVNCSLSPAIVEYPVNVSQGHVTLLPSKTALDWSKNTSEATEVDITVDQVLHLLSPPLADVPITRLDGQDAFSNPHSTLGGIALFLSHLVTSEIYIVNVNSSFPAAIVDGVFAEGFASFDKGIEPDTLFNTTVTSPMPQMIADIREVMFRSSVAIAQHKIGNWTPNETNPDGPWQMSSDAPTQRSTHPGTIQMYHTVYKTNRTILGVAISLMGLAVLSMFPLYWHYWKLGRKVSMSPLEIAKALHNTPISDRRGRKTFTSVLDTVGPGTKPQYGSNLDANKLDELIGDKTVNYGEIGGGILGFGYSVLVEHPEEGKTYC